MIPATQQRTIESSLQNYETTSLQVAVNSKTFQILTDNLYENKIQSVIRELSSNAYDSHVAAGKTDVPFKVTLPTFIDSKFAIRDYGTSMDHEAIMGLYVTLFNSTKDTSNNYTGYIGIGSKSPFAYTNTFNVTAFKDGIKRVYVLTIGEQEIPEITFLGEYDTDEPQGLEVSMSAKPGDAHKFATEAANVYLAYNVKPDCNLDLDYAEVMLESPKFGWAIYQMTNGHYRHNNTTYVKQGTCLYPTPSSIMTSMLNYRYRVVIDVPIGKLNVAASRETLSLDPTSTAYLQERLETLRQEIFDEMNDSINQAEYWLDAARLHHRYNVMTYNQPGHNLVKRRNENEPLLQIYLSKQFDARIGVFTSSSKDMEWVTPGEILSVNLTPNYYSHVIIDRQNCKIKRRMARVKKYATQTNALFVENPSNKDLAQLWKLLDGANREQDFFKSVHNLPDVEINYSSNSTGKLRGLYDMSGNNILVMPESYWWITIQDIRHLQTQSLPISVKGQRMTAYTLQQLLRYLNLADMLVYATPTQSKKLDPNRSIDRAVSRKFEEEGFEQKIRQELVRQIVNERVMFIPEPYKMADASNGDLARIGRVFMDMQEVQAEANEIVAKILSTYPMLNTQPVSQETIEEYVAIVNQHKRKQS